MLATARSNGDFANEARFLLGVGSYTPGDFRAGRLPRVLLFSGVAPLGRDEAELLGVAFPAWLADLVVRPGVAVEGEDVFFLVVSSAMLTGEKSFKVRKDHY